MSAAAYCCRPAVAEASDRSTLKLDAGKRRRAAGLCVEKAHGIANRGAAEAAGRMTAPESSELTLPTHGRSQTCRICIREADVGSPPQFRQCSKCSKSMSRTLLRRRANSMPAGRAVRASGFVFSALRRIGLPLRRLRNHQHRRLGVGRQQAMESDPMPLRPISPSLCGCTGLARLASRLEWAPVAARGRCTCVALNTDHERHPGPVDH